MFFILDNETVLNMNGFSAKSNKLFCMQIREGIHIMEGKKK